MDNIVPFGQLQAHIVGYTSPVRLKKVKY